jgi:hypothetical protein
MNLQTCEDVESLISVSIERSVRMRTGGTIKDLRVDVDSGAVIITGRAPTYYTKQLATHAVFETVDDVCLTNDIEVY